MEFEHIDNCILFRYRPNLTEINGFFDQDDGHIYIRKGLGKIDKEIVYQHEMQHKICSDNKCFCWEQKSDFWSEYHSFRAELDFALRSNKIVKRIYLTGVIDDLIKYKKQGKKIKSQKEHYFALRRVCKLNRFKKLAKEYKYWNRIKKLL